MRLRLFLSMLLVLPGSLVLASPPVAPKMTVTKKGMVVTCQPMAAQIGVDILKAGGNAADAYVATTLAEYVTAFGYTSLSGPLYLLYFDAKSKTSAYLNAGLNTVADPSGQWSEKTKAPGTSYVIGGAGRGLEALFKRFGSSKFSLKDLVAPSVSLAKSGFHLYPEYAVKISKRMSVLGGSSAWMSLFTKNGIPLSAGKILVQPDLADTLSHFSQDGADYLFKGKFATDLVRSIREQGGKLTLQDLADYQVYWSEPLDVGYRSYTIRTSSYRSYGGLELLLNLKTIENFPDLASKPHFSSNQNTFNTVLRTFLFSNRAIFPFMDFQHRMDDLADMKKLLNGPLPEQLWKQVVDPAVATPFTADTGHHSCNTVVIDRQGNIATGTHTINALAWGDFGLFVNGVSLNSAHAVALNAPPGTRAIDGLNPVLVFKNDKPVLAAGFFSSGLHSAAFQILLNLLDYGMPPQQAMGSPRFGPPTSFKPVTMVLDARYPQSWVKDFSEKGIHFSQPSGFIDTGMGMVIGIDQDSGLRYGTPTERLSFPVAVSE